MKRRKPLPIFIFSALAFILANNLHFLSYNRLTPRLLDWTGYVLFIFGLIVLLKSQKIKN